jgi:H+-transporting ATPase
VVAGLFRHDPLPEMVQFALILTVASIPVALPAVLSVTLAVGSERLARMKATRNTGWFWQRPWPSWKLVVPCEATQILGTLIVVYGLAMAPIGWETALLVWAYTLISFCVANMVKVGTCWLLTCLAPAHARHLARSEGRSSA